MKHAKQAVLCANCGKPIKQSTSVTQMLIHVDTGIIWCRPLDEYPRAEIAK